MPKIFLHLGFPKTGSTYTQAFLSKNRDILESRGLRYPKIVDRRGKETLGHSTAFFAAFTEDPATHAALARQGRNSLEDKEHFIDQLSQSIDFDGDLIFSGEGIPSLSKDALKDVKEFLRRTKKRIIPICLVRDPYEYTVSHIQQSVKRERPLLVSRRSVVGHHKKLSRTFGEVRVLSYNAIRQQENDVALELLKHIGASHSGLSQPNSGSRNESLSDNATRIMGHINTVFPKSPETTAGANVRSVNDIRELRYIKGGGKFLLTNGEYDAIADDISAEVEYLTATLGESFEGKPPDTRAVPAPWSDEDIQYILDSFFTLGWPGVIGAYSYFSFYRNISDTWIEVLRGEVEKKAAKGRRTGQEIPAIQPNEKMIDGLRKGAEQTASRFLSDREIVEHIQGVNALTGRS